MLVTLLLVGTRRIARSLPHPLRAALDNWSHRKALDRREARRHMGDRSAVPLPPVVSGRPSLPHPFRG
ncbi:MAG TPA: hypothetical protein VHA82_02120 [Ramlibacter sp.]|uniref:hypothetical protein n=1 Tax=Ramlibacter sp. TaxID=1917967 RepID=UPI002C7C897D|nr:hypothetical protein [Ramlibacter sp.]HVZ42577.1 hypothetical protein [Ramlibacter sp.]